MSEKTSSKLLVKTSRRTLLTIQDNPEISIDELAEIIGVTTRTIERQIKKLKAANYIRRVGSDKLGHWKVLQTVEKSQDEDK